jgi:hypothetical protein
MADPVNVVQREQLQHTCARRARKPPFRAVVRVVCRQVGFLLTLQPLGLSREVFTGTSESAEKVKMSSHRGRAKVVRLFNVRPKAVLLSPLTRLFSSSLLFFAMTTQLDALKQVTTVVADSGAFETIRGELSSSSESSSTSERAQRCSAAAGSLLCMIPRHFHRSC